MPRTKKPAGTAVDKRNGRQVVDLVPVEGARFDPPEGICPEALTAWEAYWSDVVANVLTSADRPLLTRWIREYDRYLRTIATADLEPLVAGSKGQSVENPLYKIAYRALDAAERAERQIGVGPLFRSSLGIAVIAERKSLAEMNAAYGGDGDEARPAIVAEVVDPRRG